jgi:hypothetical protein
MVHFLKLKYRISFSGLRLLRQLPYQFQCLTGITQFEKLGTFLSSWRIWAVKSDAQTAIKRAEYHAMPPFWVKSGFSCCLHGPDTFPVTDSAMPIAYSPFMKLDQIINSLPVMVR